MNEWIISFKKTFRLFLRRIYVSQKTDRERLSRPLYENKATEGRCRRPYIINLIVLSLIVGCYLLRLPSMSTSLAGDYSEKSIETSVVVKQVQGVHMPKDAKIELARNWLSKNAPNSLRFERNKAKNESSVPIETTKSYKELFKSVKGNVVFIDKESSSTTKRSATNEPPACLTRVSPEKLNLKTTMIKVSLEDIYPMVQAGGYYKPPKCSAKHKVAILVPYRDRQRNLRIFLYNIHPFLMTQNIEYRIFVIEQYGQSKFNKGRLFNAGFKEMKKYGSWQCVVFHDVDLLPTNRRIFYTCPRYPRHMSSFIIEDEMPSGRNASSPFLFGGVTAMSLEHYEKANGHSNMYWGWGGEDYDIFWRLNAATIPIVRYNKTIAKFLALFHAQARGNPMRYSLIRSAIDRWQDEGLNSIDYNVVSMKQHHLFTHILVDIQPFGDTSNMHGAVKYTESPKDIVKSRRRDPPVIHKESPQNTMYRPPTSKVRLPKPNSPFTISDVMG